MVKENIKYEEHEDLKKFEKKYNKRIDEFLKSNPETRVVFLNADFGWGKTTFIKNNLKVPENQIYSPWLNKSDNYIEEIYYNVTQKNKGRISSVSLILGAVVTILTILSGSLISIMIELCKGNTYIFQARNFKIIFSNNTNLFILLIFLICIIVFSIMGLKHFIFSKPIPIINFFKRDNGKYYEKEIIKEIVEKIDKVLVIEDIDRIDDIEDVLIVANKISEYMKDEKIDKYILITGDYIRMITRISEPNNYNDVRLDFSKYRNKGTFVVEKIISLRIDFSTIYERINTLLIENNLKIKLTQIEYDEIVEFIKNKYLSVRFFVRFLEKYNSEIKENNSLYHLLLKYFKEEKYFNISESVLENSIYNIKRFPICLNDIEMMLQKDGLIIEGIKYNNIKIDENKENNYEKIKNSFDELFFNKKSEYVDIFKDFYFNDVFPILATDKKNIANSNNVIIIGNTLKPANLKRDLDNFLLSYNNNEEDMGEHILINKRCYFPSVNSSNNYNYYIISQARQEDTKEVSNENFIFAYVATFFRKNNNEIERNYPKIKELISDIIR